MTVPDYQQRVIFELSELQTKIQNLEKFTNTETFNSLDQIDSNLLVCQLHAMAAYELILKQRIQRFENAAKR